MCSFEMPRIPHCFHLTRSVNFLLNTLMNVIYACTEAIIGTLHLSENYAIQFLSLGAIIILGIYHFSRYQQILMECYILTN